MSDLVDSTTRTEWGVEITDHRGTHVLGTWTREQAEQEVRSFADLQGRVVSRTVTTTAWNARGEG